MNRGEAFIREILQPAVGTISTITDAQVSPDGSRISMTGWILHDLSSPARPQAFLVGVDGPQSLTARASQGAQFAPGGEYIGLLVESTSGGPWDLVIMTLGLNEPRRLAEFEGTVEAFHWSPDSSRIALVVAEPGAHVSSGQGSGKHPEDSRVDEDGPRVLDMHSEPPARSLWIVDVATAKATRLTDIRANVWEASWLGPDRIVAVTSGSTSEDAWYSSSLVTFDAGGGHLRTIVDPDQQLARPAGSSDGRYAAVIAGCASDRDLVAGRILVRDELSDTVAEVDTQGADVTSIQWVSPTQLGFVGIRHLQTVAGIVDMRIGAAKEQVVTSAAIGDASLPTGSFASDGSFVAVISEYAKPPQLSIWEPHKPMRILLSVQHAGTTIQRTRGGTISSRSWSAADGLEIEGFVITPNGDGPFPVVVNVHGGPAYAFRNQWGMGRMATVPALVANGYAVFCPNPRGSTGRGRRYAELVIGDMGGADAQDILAGIDSLVAEGIADPARLAVMGLSYGGYMSTLLAGSTDRFRAIAAMSPITDWTSQSLLSNIGDWSIKFLGADPLDGDASEHVRSPVALTGQVTAPALLVAGHLDLCTPLVQALEYYRALVRRRVPSSLITFPQEAHGVHETGAIIEVGSRIVDWFDAHVLLDAVRREHIGPQALENRNG